MEDSRNAPIPHETLGSVNIRADCAPIPPVLPDGTALPPAIVSGALNRPAGVAEAANEAAGFLKVQPVNVATRVLSAVSAPESSYSGLRATAVTYSSAIILAAAVAAFAIGIDASVLVSIETRAGAIIGQPIFGACSAFWGAELLLTVLVFSEAAHKRLPLLKWKQPPRWFHALPGLCGAAFQIAAVWVQPLVGAATFWLAAVLGQLAAAAALDHLGRAGAGQRIPFSWHRAVALLVAIGGAVMTVADRIAPTSGSSSSSSSAPATSSGITAIASILAALAGALQPLQAALNRSAGRRLYSPLQTTWWSFVGGCLSTALVWGIVVAADAEGRAALPARFASAPWWIWFAGVPGLVLIFGALQLTGVVGSSAFFVLLICGQLIGSTVIDATGFLGGAVREATPLRIAGIVVVMAAAVAMQVPPRLLPLPAAARAACAAGAFGLGGPWCAAHWPRCGRRIVPADANAPSESAAAANSTPSSPSSAVLSDSNAGIGTAAASATSDSTTCSPTAAIELPVTPTAVIEVPVTPMAVIEVPVTPMAVIEVPVTPMAGVEVAVMPMTGNPMAV